MERVAFLAVLRDQYERARKPSAILLVLLILAGGLIDNFPVQLAATVALLGIVLQLRFEIHATLSEREACWIETSAEAALEIAKSIEARLHSGRDVRVRWLGVTQETGWPATQQLLLRLFDGNFRRSASMQLELALVEPKGRIAAQTSGPDIAQIETSINRITNFIQVRCDALEDHNSTISLYTYDHQPSWHGVLVDDDTLFFAFTAPENLALASWQGGIELVQKSKGLLELARIRYFSSWFDHIADEAIRSGKARCSTSTSAK